MLKTECHLHLYGCLTTEDLYEIGRDRHKELGSRMEWFAAEYAKAFGYVPDYKSWWNSPSRFDEFRRTFEFTTPGPFPQFQAKFNLLIALNPPQADRLDLVERVLRRDEAIAAAREYRTFIPHFLSDTERESYVLNLMKRVRDASGFQFKPTIAFSIFRDKEVSESMYTWLQAFTAKHPWTAALISGIDFCGSEGGFKPSAKKSFVGRVYADNQQRPRPWDVLYHVGEMWDDISLLSAARWVVEAAQHGARRLGHAMALGVDAEILAGLTTFESMDEVKDHFTWLETHGTVLANYGYSANDAAWLKAQMDAQGDRVMWTWTDQLISHTTRFQNATLQMTRDLDPLIEVCVTSNMRIGQLTKVTQHPLRRFLKAGLRVAVSTDDPGIFAITLADEEQTLIRDFGCTPEELARFETEATRILS